ncbi:hypothetical protein ACXR0O_16420 [Verrucomicrobiota bacterium sgz303538]
MNEANTARTSILPAGSLVAIAFFSLAWLMMLSGPVFPMSIILALFCTASPFAIGVLAWLLYRRRTRSTAHRIACYASLTFVGILAVSIWAGLLFSGRSIAAADLVGTYVPDQPTKADLDERLHLFTANHKIELRGDGTFAMTDIPDFWQLTGTPTALISATGTWSLRGRAVAIEYTGASSIPPHDPPDYHYSATINIVGLFAPYRLRFTLGDPDSGYNATFAKTQ